MANTKPITLEQFQQLKSLLQKEGRLKIELVTGSMTPIMPTGTQAVIEPCEFDDLRQFDSIVFFNDGILVCHAIWDRGQFPAANGDRTVLTRGLMNPLSDDPVRESHILGRVTSHEVTKKRFMTSLVIAELRRRFGLQRQTH